MTLPGLDRYLTTEPEDAQNALSPDYEAEQERERRWNDFMSACQEFANDEPSGWAAVVRAVGLAMSEQRRLPYGH